MAVTLKQLAEASGSSVRSVSRALRNLPGVSDKRRELILRTADQLGYIPNIAARNLRLQRSNFVGIIVSPHPTEIQQRRLADLQLRLEAQGFYPLMGNLESPEQLRQMLTDWSGIVAWVVFFSWPDHFDTEKLLRQAGQRYIFVDCREADDNRRDIFINIDRQAGIEQGVTQLLQSGYRRIVFCGKKMPGRIAGFEAAFAGYQAQKSYLFTTGLDFVDGYGIGEQVINEGFDALFCATDRLAFGFLKYAYEHNLKIPRQIAVIGFDDDLSSRYSCPALSSVAHPNQAINSEIIEIITAKEVKTTIFCYPTFFRQRESS